MILPCSLTTQIAVFASDTSNPTNSFIPQSSMWIQYGKVDNLPLILQATTGSAQRRPRYGISFWVHSQNITVAARATAERNTFGHLSYRVATRRQSFRRPNMISILLRRL